VSRQRQETSAAAGGERIQEDASVIVTPSELRRIIRVRLVFRDFVPYGLTSACATPRNASDACDRCAFLQTIITCRFRETPGHRHRNQPSARDLGNRTNAAAAARRQVSSRSRA
jgi:hypothetical protein